MKLKYRQKVLFLALLVALATCTAQTQSTPPEPLPHRLLFWKVTSPTNTVYLLGSIHVGDKDLYPLPDAVESAFNNSKVLAVEINIKGANMGAVNKAMLHYGFYPEGDLLSKHLPKSTALALGDFCREHGFPGILLEKLKPWAVAITIEGLAFQQAGEDPALGIDMHFLNEVKEQKIEELETADFQVSVLSSGTEAEQQEVLAGTLREMDKAKENMKKLKDAYLSGDPDAVQKLLEEQGTPKSLYKRLLYDRNGPMAERIDGYLKGNDQCFVVVGLAHLVGNQGVVKLLQQKNYQVELIKAEMK